MGENTQAEEKVSISVSEYKALIETAIRLEYESKIKELTKDYEEKLAEALNRENSWYKYFSNERDAKAKVDAELSAIKKYFEACPTAKTDMDIWYTTDKGDEEI